MSHPHEAVWTCATSAFAARCLHVIADHGVADHIDDRPVPVEALAASCNLDADALDRVLGLLATHGFFEHRSGSYAHTAPSRLLRSDHPQSMRAFARMMGLPALWSSLSELDHSLRVGSPAIETIEPRGFWSYLQDRPTEVDIFGQAMAAKANADVVAVLAAYDFARFTTIADIGGGRGHLLRAVLDTVPAHGFLFDLPQVIDTLDDGHPQMTTVAADFFVDPLPSADAYVLMEVLHDWPDADAAAILRGVRRAAAPGATLLVIENVLDDERSDPRGRTLDIIMLTVTGGRERTTDQLDTLFHHSGFRLASITDTAGPMRVVEATAA